MNTVASIDNRIPLLPVEEFERRCRRADSLLQSLWQLLDEVKDPEIPVVSIWQLGVLQDIQLRGVTVVVTITPTYSGCPAMAVITEDIELALEKGGYTRCEVITRLSPAWSTSWIDEEARSALRRYGIAPPPAAGESADDEESVVCPQCGSSQTQLISEFGSTACKSLHRCQDCAEPFDRFKPI